MRVSFVVALGLVSFSQALDHVKFGASRVIQPNPCAHERTGEEGVCMFAWDCLNLNGTHITFCRDRFYYGSCCKLPEGVQAPNRSPPGYHNPPSNHLDATTRRPVTTTTPDAIEVQYGEDVATSRPPVVEVQFPRDPTPKPTIPPAIPTLYPIVPPTTQRRPIVVNNHHKKPGQFPLKGTTVPPTPRPRPTEEVTTMAITEVPTGNPTWIVADEADKNGRPTTTPEALEDSSPVATNPDSVGTTQRPAIAETTIRTSEETTTAPPLTTTAAAETSTTFSSADVTTTTAAAAADAEDTPEQTQSPEGAPGPIQEQNSIDLTTESIPTTTRFFSTRYPIRFPPKEKVTTTTTEEPEMSSEPATAATPAVKEPETASPEADLPTTTSTTTTTTPITTTTAEPQAPSESVSGSADNAPVPTEAGPIVESTLTPQPASSEIPQVSSESPSSASTDPTEETVTPTKAVPSVPATAASDPVTESTSTSSTTTTTTSTTTTTQAIETTTEYDPIKAICGMPKSFASGRIVGGELTRFGKWPWMISLRQFKKNSFVHKCGAALLNEYWAVSAAHCVHNVSPNDILLRLGEYDLSGHDKEPLGHIERRVQIVATHPRFDAHTFEYDLALMRFYEPVTFADNIIPICIAEGNHSYVGETAVVTGWGRLYEDGPLPSVLQKVQIPIITNQECERLYRKAGFVEDIPQIFICAGMPSGGKDSCEGDSGGPLVLKDEESGQWNLIGIISWGIGCAMPNQPGVYTRITKFADWIKQIIVF
ncbi:serine proteinase stubble [Galendromus occidentalis]|uniref:Serine proteinase stubble n=1 Tax=Galendromus occidentalis TaxID=34638 RepID=A0AAJ7SE48_9ACAR|nr:serine proteinase stubble [Galendromus occidentalis]